MSRHLVSHGRARLPPGSPVASDQLEDGSRGISHLRRSWIAGVMRAAGGRAQERRSMEFEASRLAAVGGDRAQAIADLQQAKGRDALEDEEAERPDVGLCVWPKNSESN